MSWTGILLLAAGAYFFKALGLLVVGPLLSRQNGTDADGSGDGVAVQVAQLLPPALLAALVISQTVVTGTDLVLDARLAGVVAGAAAVGARAPFWLVLVVSAAVTAAVRQVA